VKPYYEDGNGIVIYHGNALSILRLMESESVQCCVTSPAYWGLRDYGVEPSIWDGDSECVHEWGDCSIKKYAPKRDHNGAKEFGDTRGQEPCRQGFETNLIQGQFCQKCGAWCGCYGLEPTPELYVEHTVQIFHEVKRVLKDDGTLWLNLGDSYATHASKRSGQFGNGIKSGFDDVFTKRKTPAHEIGLKEKDLVGIPWRVAFALQSDGWYLRSDIIWHKPNPMPESVTDRPTKSHEYVFLMSKSRKYYYDAGAVAEPSIYAPGCGWDDAGHEIAVKTANVINPAFRAIKETRNKRTVWTVATKPYKEAHFATFPPDLIIHCIKAGSRKGDMVLDPFGGSMTTAYVAKELNRKAIMIELNAEYIDMGIFRFRQEVLPL